MARFNHMKIGPIEIPQLCRLAPMAAISNAAFRLVAKECGSGLTTTEEIDAFALLMDTPRAGDMTAYYPQERPLAMQLLGRDPQALIRAAYRCEELGADIVDLNMGCPMPKITGKGKGAALMRDVPATARLLRAMRQSITVPFTIKIRGGWDDEHLNAVEVARMAESEGVDAITVHPRTRSSASRARPRGRSSPRWSTPCASPSPATATWTPRPPRGAWWRRRAASR